MVYWIAVVLALVLIEYIAFYEPISMSVHSTAWLLYLVAQNSLLGITFVFAFVVYNYDLRDEGSSAFLLLLLAIFLYTVGFFFFSSAAWIDGDGAKIFNVLFVAAYVCIFLAASRDAKSSQETFKAAQSGQAGAAYSYRLPATFLPFFLFGSLFFSAFVCKARAHDPAWMTLFWCAGLFFSPSWIGRY